jgi:hypothetical protein
MPKKIPELPAANSGTRRHEWLWSGGIALSSLLAAWAVVYLLSLPVVLVR